MVFTWSRVSDRAHDSTCSIWRQATEDAVRYFTCFSLLLLTLIEGFNSVEIELSCRWGL